MNSDVVTKGDPGNEGFVLVVDGTAKSKHRVFAEAAKAGLALRKQSPQSVVRICDAGNLAA